MIEIMRTTTFTPTPERLEIQPEDVTIEMKKNYASVWSALSDHLNEIHDSSWWRTDRSHGLIKDNPLRYSIQPAHKDLYEPLFLELIPQDIEKYAREGIQPSIDIICIFGEDDHQFMPITFCDYDAIYNRVVDEDEDLSNLSDRIIDHLSGLLEDDTLQA